MAVLKTGFLARDGDAFGNPTKALQSFNATSGRTSVD